MSITSMPDEEKLHTGLSAMCLFTTVSTLPHKGLYDGLYCKSMIIDPSVCQA